MGRFIFFLAFLILGAGIFMFVVFLSDPDDGWAKTIFESALCQEGEEFTQWIGSYIPRSAGSGGGYETAFYCTNSKGDERDVTLNAIGIIAGSFAIPLIISLIMFFVGGGMMVKNRMKAAMQGNSSFGGTWVNTSQPQMQVFDLRDGSYQGGEVPAEKIAQAKQILNSFGVDNFSKVTVTTSGGEIPPEKMEQVQQILNSFGLNNMATGSSGGSLTERLKQVEDARQQGLISQSEYERLRQEILDNLNS